MQQLPKLSNSLRIIKKSTCSKISPQARGQLTYHIGYDETAKTFHLRVTENTGGGFFSNEWIRLDNILETVEALPSIEPFKAVIFIPLYNSTTQQAQTITAFWRRRYVRKEYWVPLTVNHFRLRLTISKISQQRRLS